MKTYEYHEGKRAQEDFEEGMKTLFQVPKEASLQAKKKPAKKQAKKKPSDDVSRDSGEDA